MRSKLGMFEKEQKKKTTENATRTFFVFECDKIENFAKFMN